MKTLKLLFVMLLAVVTLTAQPPQAMKYKAIAKDEWGAALPNKDISLRFTIYQGSEYGTPVYIETHQTTTDKAGLMDVNIGQGTASLNTFSTIDWSADNYYIQIELDTKGGSDFNLTSESSQLLSVPYALYAGSSSSAANETDPVFSGHPANGITSGDIINWNTTYSWGDHMGLYKLMSYVPDWSEIIGKPTFATVAISGSYNDLLDKPTLFSGDYNDLTNKPTLFSGNYDDLIGNPTSLSQFNNDVGFLTVEIDPVFTVHPSKGITSGNIDNWNVAFGWGNHAGLYKPVAYVPDWSEITNKPNTLGGYGITDAVTTTGDIEFINSLKKGDQVLTIGGIYGKIEIIQESYVIMDAGNNVLLKVNKNALRRPLDN